MRKEFMLGDIPVTMERRKVKNLNLYVQPPEGRVLATIPWRMREADAIKFIRSKENWIRTAREKVRSRQKSAERREKPPFLIQRKRSKNCKKKSFVWPRTGSRSWVSTVPVGSFAR